MSATATRLKRLEQNKQKAADAEAERFIANLPNMSDVELNLAIQAAYRVELVTHGEAWVRQDMEGYTPEFIDWLLHGETTEESAAQWIGERIFTAEYIEQAERGGA